MYKLNNVGGFPLLRKFHMRNRIVILGCFDQPSPGSVFRVDFLRFPVENAVRSEELGVRSGGSGAQNLEAPLFLL